MQTLDALSQALTSGNLRARTLIDQAMDRIVDPGGEGSRAFVSINQSARAQADEIDRRRAKGDALPPFAGIPLGLKDLFDVAGEITSAGSRIFAHEAPALRDAPTVARLRAAGFVFMGRNNMTEFAFSGLGLNPHYGTPASPFDRTTRRIPGGSTSGGAVAVADGMTVASLGTDTGGSCRIPAAFCGIVGFKPTANRVPRDGATPLAHSLDSIGPLANSVDCCATLDAILRGVTPRPLADVSLGEIRLLLPTSLVLDGRDEHVAKAFERAIDTLTRSGTTISRQPLTELLRIPEINSRGGIAAAEAYAWHKPLLESHRAQYDQRVANRILKGGELTAQDVRELYDARADVIDAVAKVTNEFDALVMPTTPIIPPPMSAFGQDADYVRLNGLVLRNPSLGNFLDRCAISLPVHARGEAPVGLMLIGRRDDDRRLLAIARAFEAELNRTRL
ncbi:amidase [Peristeroidobacter soli]|uniref:amidase n=1 Tax=Peristeroidobacter soli TaxID=2497877 RepID=UPI00101D2D74|nr:amidase [Peristeroidobacter soli]